MRFAIQDGKFVHVDTYDDSKPCYCHSCGRRVTQLWENNIKSFKHIDGKPCKWYSTESNIHIAFKEAFISLKGKEVLLSRGTLLSAVCGDVDGSGDVLLNPMKVRVYGVYFEMDLRKLIPDIVLKTDKGYIYVEIVFSHGLSEKKLSRINGLCLQVKVSKAQIREWSRYGNKCSEVDILKYLDCFPSCVKWYNDEYTDEVVKLLKEKTMVYKGGDTIVECLNGSKLVSTVCRTCRYNVVEKYKGYPIINPSMMLGNTIYCGYIGGLSKDMFKKKGQQVII